MMHSENQKRNPKFRLPFSAVLLYLVLIAVSPTVVPVMYLEKVTPDTAAAISAR